MTLVIRQIHPFGVCTSFELPALFHSSLVMNFLRTRLFGSSPPLFRSQVRTMHIQSIPMCRLLSRSHYINYQSRVAPSNIAGICAYSVSILQGRGRATTMPTLWQMNRPSSLLLLIRPTLRSELHLDIELKYCTSWTDYVESQSCTGAQVSDWFWQD